jgi:hypothetical protein
MTREEIVEWIDTVIAYETSTSRAAAEKIADRWEDEVDTAFQWGVHVGQESCS